MKNITLIGRISILILALLLSAAVFVACGGGEVEDESSEEGTQSEAPSETEIPDHLFDFFGGSPEEYVIVFPGTSGSVVKNAAKSLAVTLNFAYGTELETKGDTRVEAAGSPKEILVGLTNREESKRLQEGIENDNDFVIKLEGERLVIVGGNHEGTARGVEYFIENYILGKNYETLMIDKEMDLTWIYREECASLYTLAENYKIIYGDRAETSVRKLARSLAEELNELTEAEMEATSDMVIGVPVTSTDYESPDKEILLGVTNRKESNEGEALEYMDYEIRYTDTKIILRGGSLEALRRAVRAFADGVESGRTASLTDPSNNRLDCFFSPDGAGSMITEFDSFTPVWAKDYTVPDWATDLNEKIVAVTAMNARNMSAVRGGDGVNYPAYSAEAIASAIKVGVDLIVLNVQETADGVLMAFPTEELSVATNADTVGGLAGLPVSTSINDWTYSELTQLRFKDADGEVTDCSLLTLYEAVALCKGRCFITVSLPEIEYDANEIMFDILSEHDAFLSYFVPDPTEQTVSQPLTMDALVDFSAKSASAAEALAVWKAQLTDASGNDLKNRGGRKLFENNSKTDDEAGWQAMREEWKTFLYTQKPVEYCQYVTENFPSALVSTETVTSDTSYTIADPTKLNGRVMVFSDPHYFNRNNRYGEDKTDTNNDLTIVQNQIDMMNARLALLIDQIAAEYKGRGLDAVLVLGDLSTDNNSTQMADKYNTDYYKQFYEKLLAGLAEKGVTDLPVYCVAGNHDSILNDEWKSVFGKDRQFSFAIGNTVFLMLDTFEEDGKADNTGADYAGVDMEWVAEEMKKYEGLENRQIIACSHYMNASEYRALANTYPDLILVLGGHTHKYGVTKINDNAYFIDEGGFSYTAMSAYTGPNWDFGYLDLRTLWGYQIIEWNDDVTYTYHITVKNEYFATNMYYVVPNDIKTTDIVLRKKSA